MVNTLLGTKKNMTSSYDARGRRVGATVLQIQANLVLKTLEKDTKNGLKAVLLGYGHKKNQKKPQLGLVKKLGLEVSPKWFREVKTDEVMEAGKQIALNQVFSVGDTVKVTGASKGKGFQGGVRRWGFHGGPKTHGQSDRHRAPGSIGSGTTPGRVYKGKHMAGHMGNDTSSVRNLEVIALDKENGLLTVKGAIPGFSGGLVMVTKLGRVKGYTPPPEPEPEEPESVESAALDANVSERQDEQPTSETPITDTPVTDINAGVQGQTESTEQQPEEVTEDANQ